MKTSTLIACLVGAVSVGTVRCAAHQCVGNENGSGAGFCGEAPDTGAPPSDASMMMSPDVSFWVDSGDGGPVIHNDFMDPVIDTGAPTNSATLFAAPDQTAAGPCLTEPQIGSLFPDNWLRPRFRYTPAQSENLFEIKMTIPNEVSPLVIYTTKTTYTISKAAWNIINVVGIGKIHVTVRSGVLSNGVLTAGPFMGSQGDIEIAPVDAAGSIVYWTTSNNTELKGFRVGDETVEPVLTPTQAGASSGCVGCHTSTPDGTYVAFSVSKDSGNGYPSFTEVLSLDGKATAPPFITSTATALLARTGVGSADGQILPTLSKGHWTTGDHTILTQLWMNDHYDIAWTDLETNSSTQGTGWGIVARNGDTHNVEAPVWSHDGSTIVYNSTTSTGGTFAWDGALWTVPYNNRAGGTAKSISGANDSNYHYYYPAFSPDDKFLAFNRVPTGENEYTDVDAEVYVLPSGGGTATRVAANDPAVCSGIVSPGITNSWPKWSPEVKTANGLTYYFMVFSSDRDATAGGPQIYLAPVVVDGMGNITSYPALYLWNQPETEHNHTPAWDNFAIPVIPPN